MAIVHGRRLRKVKSQKQGIRLLIFYRLSEDLLMAVWSNPSHNVKAPRVSFFSKASFPKSEKQWEDVFPQECAFFPTVRSILDALQTASWDLSKLFRKIKKNKSKN